MDRKLKCWELALLLGVLVTLCTGAWLNREMCIRDRISNMLQNETYIGNMVQGRSVKISYKSKKCLRQDPADWVVAVSYTHLDVYKRQLHPVYIGVGADRFQNSHTGQPDCT